MSLEVTPNSRSARNRLGRAKDCQRSAITNGKLLPGIDQRSAWVRRCKDVIAQHLSDLGGEDNTSAAERSIIRRAAVLTTELERMEVSFATSDASPEAIDLYARASSNLRRLLESLGLKKRVLDLHSLEDDEALRIYREELNAP
jgi:hypothetical protein